MSWLYESFETSSPINGRIRCLRAFGQWNVVVNGTGQTNDYLNGMWKRAMKRIPRDTSVKRILILGLGTGGAFPQFYKRFPKAHISAIEIDPEMVTLSKRFHSFKKYPAPEIHIGASKDVLPKLRGPYDLIISDMFLGHDVAPETQDAELIRHIVRLLSPQGYFLINVFEQKNILMSFATPLVETARWKYHANTVGMFRQHGAGVVEDPLPDDYTPYIASEAYLKREFSDRKMFEVIQTNGVCGVRSHLGPILFDRYITRTLPILNPSKQLGWAAWYPLVRQTSRPHGWWSMGGNNWRRLTGYVDLTKLDDARSNWSELARRERKKWLSQTNFLLQPVDVEPYCAAYAKSGKSRSLIYLFSKAVREKSKRHGNLLHLWGIVSRQTGELVGGFCGLDVPEIKLSTHVNSFILEPARTSGAGVALVDHWLTTSRSANLTYADFDGFYAPGDPKSWRGFSQFKAQFGTRYIRYPNPFWRFFP